MIYTPTELPLCLGAMGPSKLEGASQGKEGVEASKSLGATLSSPESLSYLSSEDSDSVHSDKELKSSNKFICIIIIKIAKV